MKALTGKYYGLLPLLLLCGFYIVKATGFSLHDFGNYYFGGYFFAQGTFTADMYFPYIFNRDIAALGYESLFLNYAPNTPFLTLLFYPFHFLDPFTAKLIFNLLSTFLFLYSTSRLVAFYKIKPVYAAIIPVLFFLPVKNNLLFGQLYFLLFFLLAEGWLAYEKKQLFRMSLFWSMAVLIKVFPVMLIAFLLFKKAYKPAAYLIFCCALLTIGSVLLNGVEIWFFFFEKVLPKASNGEIATAFVDNYQSVYMFLKRIFITDAIENPYPAVNNPFLFHLLLMSFKLGLVFMGYYITQIKKNTLFVFSYWIIIMLLLSPYGSTYTFILLLFPFFSIVNTNSSPIVKCGFILLLCGNCNWPLQFFTNSVFPVSYCRLLLFLLFFILYLLSEKSTVNWKWSPMVLVLAAGMSYYSIHIMRPADAMGLLPVKSPVLIYKYTITDNRLTYYYWNENGENRMSIPLAASKTAEATIRNNQIYHNDKQLTYGNDNKTNALLVNNKTLIYLSDYNRGIGFYTLRVLKTE